MCPLFCAYSDGDVSSPLRGPMPTLVTFALAGMRISRTDAVAIATTAAQGRPHHVWHLPDALRIAMPFDDEPVLRLPVADAVDVRVRAATVEQLISLGRDWESAEARFRWGSLTPTTFCSRGRAFPAPDVAALLHSLASNWNEIAHADRQIDPDDVAAVGRSAIITAIDGRTRDVATPPTADIDASGALDSATPGFVGTVDARIVRGRFGESFNDAVTLLQAACYLGAGDHRDAGMGATSMTFRHDAGRR